MCGKFIISKIIFTTQPRCSSVRIVNVNTTENMASISYGRSSEALHEMILILVENYEMVVNSNASGYYPYFRQALYPICTSVHQSLSEHQASEQSSNCHLMWRLQQDRIIRCNRKCVVLWDFKKRLGMPFTQSEDYRGSTLLFSVNVGKCL